MDYIKIEARRNGYAPTQCGKTMTVGDLIALLEGYDEETPVYISNDEGYTYGNIRAWDISCEYIEDED